MDKNLSLHRVVNGSVPVWVHGGPETETETVKEKGESAPEPVP